MYYLLVYYSSRQQSIPMYQLRTQSVSKSNNLRFFIRCILLKSNN